MCLRSSNSCKKVPVRINVKHIVQLSVFPPHRETHAEDWPTAAGLHVLELHVAQDESGRSTIQVGKGAAGKTFHTANCLILVYFSFFEVFLQESTYSLMREGISCTLVVLLKKLTFNFCWFFRLAWVRMKKWTQLRLHSHSL